MYQWISWHQPTKDHRPLSYPPHEAILGWWCSGYDSNDVATLCALVAAKDERTARAAVKKEWPEATRWRFCEARETAHLGDRFRPHGWMLERMPPNT